MRMLVSVRERLKQDVNDMKSVLKGVSAYKQINADAALVPVVISPRRRESATRQVGAPQCSGILCLLLRMHLSG